MIWKFVDTFENRNKYIRSNLGSKLLGCTGPKWSFLSKEWFSGFCSWGNKYSLAGWQEGFGKSSLLHLETSTRIRASCKKGRSNGCNWASWAVSCYIFSKWLLMKESLDLGRLRRSVFNKNSSSYRQWGMQQNFDRSRSWRKGRYRKPNYGGLHCDALRARCTLSEWGLCVPLQAVHHTLLSGLLKYEHGLKS